MTSVGFYALGSAWLFALLVPLVIFYFLKLKRPRLVVPSLALWQQALADKRVNTPFQRFKRNLLLLLQIILLCLLAAAAMQPFRRGRATRARRIPVLLDCSASMAALDEAGGVSRLDAARKEVRRLIDGLLPDQELCLISFADSPRKRTGFTNDKRLLRQALDQVRVEDVPSRIEDAFRVTEALARSVGFDRVVLLSDGNFPTRAYFDLPFELDYQRLPPAGPNVGITSLNARRTAKGGWDVFAVIESSPDARGTVTVRLEQDGREAGVEHVSVEEGGSARLAFRVPGDRPSRLALRLEPAGFDSLAADDVAFLRLPALRPLQAFVPSGLTAYAHALSALPGVRISSEKDEGALAAAYDLVITDREEDLNLAGRTCCYVGLLPDALRGLLTTGEGSSSVVDWRRASPLLRHVEFADLLILDRVAFAGGAGEGDLEAQGYEVLMYGDAGPLLLRKREADRLAYFLLFHSDRSTLPYRVGFPVMVANLVQTAMDRAGLAEVRADRTGVLPRLELEPNRRYEVTAPSGRTRTAESDEAGVVSGLPAPDAGRYTVSEGGRTVARVDVALLSPSETGLRAAEEIRFDEDLSVAAASVIPPTARRLWPPLAMLAFCVLLVEWWYFNRRPGGLPS